MGAADTFDEGDRPSRLHRDSLGRPERIRTSANRFGSCRATVTLLAYKLAPLAGLEPASPVC